MKHKSQYKVIQGEVIMDILDMILKFGTKYKSK